MSEAGESSVWQVLKTDLLDPLGRFFAQPAMKSAMTKAGTLLLIATVASLLIWKVPMPAPARGFGMGALGLYIFIKMYRYDKAYHAYKKGQKARQ